MPRLLRQIWSAPIVALGLLAGWGMVEVTGSRAAGGTVLFLLGCCAGFVWLFRDGWRITVALTVVYLACFVLAHLLGLVIGSWPAVIVVAIVASVASYVWSDRRVADRAV
jgi:hypothetical protein